MTVLVSQAQTDKSTTSPTVPTLWCTAHCLVTVLWPYTVTDTATTAHGSCHTHTRSLSLSLSPWPLDHSEKYGLLETNRRIFSCVVSKSLMIRRLFSRANISTTWWQLRNILLVFTWGIEVSPHWLAHLWHFVYYKQRDKGEGVAG